MAHSGLHNYQTSREIPPWETFMLVGLATPATNHGPDGYGEPGTTAIKLSDRGSGTRHAVL